MPGLAHRVIPTLLCRGRQLVKGTQFNSWRSVGLVAQAVRIHQMRQVDELIILDIGATAEGRIPDLGLIEELTKECFMPITVGGGVRTLQDIDRLMRAGADKVSICTGAFDTGIIAAGARHYGSQAIVSSVDVRDLTVCSHCGKEKWKVTPATFCDLQQENGAGEILLTSIDREGTMSGYDLDLIRQAASLLSIPLIANGGAGTYEHMREAIEAGADAVAAGAMFQFTDATPIGASKYLQDHGIEART